MALYDDAKFIFLASAAAGLETKDASKVYNAKPAPVVSSGGAVAMSGFASASTDSGNAVIIVGETAAFVGDGTAGFTRILETGIFEDNKKYKIVADFVINSGELKVQSGGGSDNENIGVVTESGTFTFFFAAASSGQNANLVFGRRTEDVAYNFSVSNVSVFEVDTVPADFDISRDDNLDATRVGPDGLIEKGLENKFTYSNNFASTLASGDDSWGHHGLATMKSKDSASPQPQPGYDGTTNAALITASVGSSTSHHRIQRDSISFDGVQTFSIHVKKQGIYDFFAITTNLASRDVYFNIANGTIASQGADSIDATIVNIGDGWYRVSSTVNMNVTALRFNICQESGSTQFQGDGESGFLIQDAQWQLGLVPTDYMHSETTTTGKAGIKEDEPRFDYPVAGGPPSLLIEPQRKNELDFSEYVGGWNQNTATVALSPDNSPEGVKNAYRVTGGSGTQAGRSVTVTDGSTYTGSIYIKKVSGADTAKLINTNLVSTTVNITTEWQRFQVTATKSGDATGRLYVQVASNSSDNVIDIFGGQLEEGDFATSYIPCHGAAATRSADVLPEVTHGITLGTAVTVLLEARVFGGGGQISLLQLRVNDENRFLFFTSSSSVDSTHDINIQHRESDVPKAIQKDGLTRGDIFKCIGRVDGTTFNMFVNGVKLGTTQTVVAADIFDKISLIRNGDVTNQSGHKNKSVVVWASALTDQQCIDLTEL